VAKRTLISQACRSLTNTFRQRSTLKFVVLQCYDNHVSLTSLSSDFLCPGGIRELWFTKRQHVFFTLQKVPKN
jgi:hypothetical protein